jgi:hypothetical protein
VVAVEDGSLSLPLGSYKPMSSRQSNLTSSVELLPRTSPGQR